MLRVGFVGCGFMGQVAHLPNFLDRPECQVVALAEHRQELAAKVAARHHIPRVYRSHEEMLENEGLDCVVSITAPELNPVTSQAALRKGLYVMVEKPMAVNAAEAEAMAQAEAASEGYLMVAFMKRYDPGVEKAKSLLEEFRGSGEMGELLRVEAHCFGGDWICGKPEYLTSEGAPYPAPPAAVRGEISESLREMYMAFNNVCSHNVNLLRWLLGARPRVEHAWVQPRTMSVEFDFGGVPGHFSFGFVQAGWWVEEIVTYFSKGWLRLRTPPPLLRNVPAEIEVYRGGERNETRVPRAPWGWAFRRQADHLLECVQRRARPLSCAADSVEDVRLVEEIFLHCSKGARP